MSIRAHPADRERRARRRRSDAPVAAARAAVAGGLLAAPGAARTETPLPQPQGDAVDVARLSAADIESDRCALAPEARGGT